MRIKKILRQKQGTTLVEMMACLTLISIMLLMAARGLSSASRIFLRLQKTQYAQFHSGYSHDRAAERGRRGHRVCEDL